MHSQGSSSAWHQRRNLVLAILSTALISSALTAYVIKILEQPTAGSGVFEDAEAADASGGGQGTSAGSTAPAYLSDADVSKSRFLIKPYVSSTQVFGPLQWNQLGPSVQSDFLLGGQVALVHWFFSDVSENSSPVWPKKRIASMVHLAEVGDPNVGVHLSSYGPPANKAFFDALKEYPVQGKTVLVIGSRNPWVEAICIANGAKHVTTVDFNPPKADYPGLTVMSLADLDNTNERYQAVFSYSSLEHDGLGRYGDPIHPFGDFERMKKIQELISDDGLLYLGVPNGNDTFVFNAHRIYGPIRFPMLIEGWNLLGTFGISLKDAYRGKARRDGPNQPLHVLKLKTR